MRRSIVLLVLVDAGCSGPPTDAQLSRRWSQHRPELEQLVEMFRSDSGLGGSEKISRNQQIRLASA